MSTVEDDGGVLVEGELVGRLDGFRFIPAPSTGADVKGLKAAWAQAVAKEILGRAQTLAAAPDPAFSIDREARIVWHGAAVARLQAGTSALQPRIVLIADEQLTGPDRDAVAERLQKFLTRHIEGVLEPLAKLAQAEDVQGLARGLAFRLVENLGVVAREDVADDVKALSQDDRAGLRRYGVKFGAFHVFMPALLKPAPSALRLVLWGLSLEKDGKLDASAMPPMPGQGLTSVPFDRATPRGFYRTVGFRICGERCVRIDMLERLADTIRDRVFWKPRFEGEARPAGSVEGGGFSVVPDMMSLVGCSGEEFAGILRSLGYRSETRTLAPEPVAAAPVAAATPAPVEPSGWDETALDQPAPVEIAPEAAAEAVPEIASADEAAGEAQAAPVEPEPVAGEASVVAADDAAAAPADAAGPPQAREIVVWWPKDTGPFRRRKPEGRPEGQRPRRPRRGGPPQAVAAGEPGVTAPGAAPAEQPAGDQPPAEGERGPRRRGRGQPRQGDDRRDRRPDRAGSPAAEGRPPRENDGGRPDDRKRDDRKRDDRSRDDRKRDDRRRDDRKGGGSEPRRYEAAPPASDRASDSPFAVLGALKEKLARGQ